MMDAWEANQDRIDIRAASLQLLIAQSGGLKKRSGGALSVEDFLPDRIRRKKRKADPKAREAILQSTLKALAAMNRKPKSDGS